MGGEDELLDGEHVCLRLQPPPRVRVPLVHLMRDATHEVLVRMLDTTHEVLVQMSDTTGWAMDYPPASAAAPDAHHVSTNTGRDLGRVSTNGGRDVIYIYI